MKNAIEHNECVVDHPGEYVTTARFDDAFNAFHHQTLDYLFPYSTKHAEESWWYSSVHMAIKCEMTFRGHMVLHTQIKALNPCHRPYPRKLIQREEVLIKLFELVVQEEIPVKYRNSSVFLGWERDGHDHQKLSSTYCLPPPPPHMPIKPFALLEAPIPVKLN